MTSDHRRRLNDIEAALLDDHTSLASALRQCVALGGAVHSAPLRDWALRELKGYPDDAELPDYREIGGQLRMDYNNGVKFWSGEAVALSQLPKELPPKVRDLFEDAYKAYQGVGQLEDMVRYAKANADQAKVSPPSAVAIQGLMSHQLGYYVTALYWSIGTPAIVGCLDAIRTAAIEIVAEMRAATADDEPIPTAVADQAVNVVVNGGERLVFNILAPSAGSSAVTSSSSGGADSIVSSAAGGSTSSVSTAAPDRESARWGKRQVIWGIVGVAVAIVGIVLGLIFT